MQMHFAVSETAGSQSAIGGLYPHGRGWVKIAWCDHLPSIFGGKLVILGSDVFGATNTWHVFVFHMGCQVSFHYSLVGCLFDISSIFLQINKGIYRYLKGWVAYACPE